MCYDQIFHAASRSAVMGHKSPTVHCERDVLAVGRQRHSADRRACCKGSSSRDWSAVNGSTNSLKFNVIFNVLLRRERITDDDGRVGVAGQVRTAWVVTE